MMAIILEAFPLMCNSNAMVCAAAFVVKCVKWWKSMDVGAVFFYGWK